MQESIKPSYCNNDPIKECAAKCKNGDRCKMSDSVCGWRCRHLIVVPDRLPENDKDRKTLFSQVYSLARRLGVLSCPYFKESDIDNIVEDNETIEQMIESFPTTFQL